MHTVAVPAWVWVIIFSNACAFAMWKGGPTEKAGAASMVLAWMLTTVVRHQRWSEPQLGMFAVDVVLLAFLVALCLRSDRYWPIFASGFQLLTVLTHVAAVIDAQLPHWAYITASIIWTYLVVAALALGTALRWRERLRRQEICEDGQASGLRKR